MQEYVIAKYIRLSLDDVASDSMSIENQKTIIDKHIEGLKMPNAETIELVDNGYSGTSFERPAVQQLLELVREGKVNCIIVKDFSRFGRNAIETGYFLERVFPLFRVRFISVCDGYDSADHDGDTGGIEVAFKFLLHEQYSRDLSIKIKTAFHEKMRCGEYVRKNCLFGYILNDARQMVIDEPAAETVRLIFNLASDGNSYADIAKRLYEDKRPTPSKHKGLRKNNDCSWTISHIYYLLHDEQYTGVYIAGRSEKVDVGSKEIVAKPESEWYKIPGHHPAIIEKHLFDAVQARFGKKGEPKRKMAIGTSQRYKNIDSPLKGIAVCGCCGHVMRLSNTKNMRFRCVFTRAASDAECYRLSISAQELADMLFDVILKQVQVILNIDCLEMVNSLNRTAAQLSEVEKQIATCQDEKCRLYECLTFGEIDVETYKAEKASVEENISRLDTARSKLAADNEKNLSLKAANDDLRKAAESASAEKTLTRSLIDTLISKVYIYPGDRVEIEWKVAGFGETIISQK